MRNLDPGFETLDAIKSDGTVVAAAKSGPNKGCTLLANTTYFFVIGGDQSTLSADMALVSAQLAWAAAVVATITLETTNFPKYENGAPSGGQPDVTDYDTTPGNWVQCNPSSAVVDVTGTGNTASGATVTAGGTNAGGAMFDVGNLGARRARIKVVVGAVGGLVRCGAHGKLPR